MKRTVDALRICANKLAWHRVGHRRLVATEACRMAENGEEFIARVRDEVGLELEIIGREMEAKLAAVGAEPLIEPGAANALVFDIGGGSTELMWLEQREDRYEIVTWISLAAGVVTVSERFGGVDVDKAKYAGMREHLRPMLVDFAERVRSSTGGQALPVHLLGTSGTVTTIAGVQLGLRRYDRARVDGCWLEQDGDRPGLFAASGHELCRAHGQSLHRARPRRPGAGGLRHPRGDLRRLPGVAHPRCRSRPARRHTDLDDEDRRHFRQHAMTRPGGTSIKNTRRLKVRVKTGKGRTVSQKIWLERQLNDPYVAEARNARAIARAPPSSSARSTTSTAFSSPAAASSIWAPHPAAGRRWPSSG